jgi:hypothetical protein
VETSKPHIPTGQSQSIFGAPLGDRSPASEPQSQASWRPELSPGAGRLLRRQGSSHNWVITVNKIAICLALNMGQALCQTFYKC